MNIVSLENVSKNYGFKPLFERVTLGLEERDKIGIIGVNGSGKTTLLRIIAGSEQPDTGRVTRAKGKSLAFLSQNPPYDGDLTVLETIFASSSGVMQTIRDYEAVCHDVAGGQDDTATLHRMSDLQHELEMNGGWDIEANARAVLTRLDITDTAAKMGQLSGGQRKHVALAPRAYLQTRHFDPGRADQPSRRRHDPVARILSRALHRRAAVGHARPLLS